MRTENGRPVGGEQMASHLASHTGTSAHGSPTAHAARQLGKASTSVWWSPSASAWPAKLLLFTMRCTPRTLVLARHAVGPEVIPLLPRVAMVEVLAEIGPPQHLPHARYRELRLPPCWLHGPTPPPPPPPRCSPRCVMLRPNPSLSLLSTPSFACRSLPARLRSSLRRFVFYTLESQPSARHPIRLS